MNDSSQRRPCPTGCPWILAAPITWRVCSSYDIGIRLNGTDRKDVEEYCISEGWVKVPAGRDGSTARAARC